VLTVFDAPPTRRHAGAVRLDGARGAGGERLLRRFPVPQLRLVLRPVDGSGVRGGTTYAARTTASR